VTDLRVESVEERNLLRAEIDLALARDPERAAEFRALVASDPALFASLFAVTYDPRLAGAKTVPFVLFPRQRDLVAWLGEREVRREHGVVEKTREVGVTWTTVAYAIWKFLFEPGTKVGFGSRKEALVDQADNPDAILEKARIVLRNLPAWLVAGEGVGWRSHHLRLINETNGATITGEAGDHIGRGGRSTLYFVDEAAHLPHPTSVEAALESNANAVVWVSTPAGFDDWFHRRARRGPTFTFRWQDDPRKGPAWYAAKKATVDPVILAREVDIDHAAARGNLVIEPAWIEASRKLPGLLRARGVALPGDPADAGLNGAPPVGGPVVAGLDVGLDRDLSAYVARRGPRVLRVETWEGGRTDEVADRALALADEDGAVRLAVDAIGLGRGVVERLEDAAEARRRHALRGVPDDPEDADLYREILRSQGADGTRAVEGFVVDAVNAGARASDGLWPDGARAFEKFANLRAELWWTLRDLLGRTAAVAEGIERGDVDPARVDLGELLLLPDDPDLARELASLSWFERNGRIVIEAKDALRRRGVPSPDRADALVLTYAPSSSARLVVTEIAGF